MTSRWMVCAFITIGVASFATSSAKTQTPSSEDPTPASPTAEEVPPAFSIEYPESTKKKKEKKRKPEPEETDVYSRYVQGKLWLEGFVGPSSYDPDRFGAGNAFFELVGVNIPRVKGPEFGAAFGGAVADIFFIGASYRQANLEIGEGLGGYNLMKVGLDMQFVFSFVPYVHPLVRLGLGYARLFGGNFSGSDVKNNGFYYTIGAGIRVPIIRWLSFVATFDWSKPTIYPKGGEGFSFDGSQLTGTFGLTLHFLGVKKK